MPYEPMSIDEKRRLASITLDLRTALMVGNPAPVVAEMWRRHNHPEPGDWVIETSTINALLLDGGAYRTSDKWDDAKIRDLWDGQFTRFLRTERRPIYTDEEWADAADPGQEPPTELAYICENPDGTEYAWTNAELATVPLDSRLRPTP